MSEQAPQMVHRIATDEDHTMEFDPPVQLIRLPMVVGSDLVNLCYRYDELLASMPEEDREPFTLWFEEFGDELEDRDGTRMVPADELNRYIELD